MRKLFILVFMVVLFSPNTKAFGYETMKLSLKKGFSYVLMFDEKVEQLKIGDKSVVEAEVINNIFTDRKQVVLTPLMNKSTNILIWTKSETYNFEIESNLESASDSAPRVLEFNQTDPELKAKMGDLQLDAPPSTNKTHSVSKIEIDKPPFIKVREK